MVIISMEYQWINMGYESDMVMIQDDCTNGYEWNFITSWIYVFS